MASYTDKIPQFSPYVEQLPVEAMVKVGMEKQRRYDEGVKRIQTEVDKIAGMDVIRDVDRQYLQSKLDQLSTQLRTVAAGDFSDNQLASSTAGMAAQIGRDPILLNSVASTARYRDEVKRMNEARKEGKSSVQNEWDFDLNSGEWLNSKDLNKSYNSRYQKYIDVDEKWLKVFKDLHSDLREYDIPYERNPDGSINRDKTAAAMQRISKETVSAAKIENALRASLSPEELNQLSINGRYQFRGVAPDVIAKQAVQKYQAQIDENLSNIKDLQGFANLSTSDPVKRVKALQTIEDLKAMNTSLSEQRSSEYQMVQMNPEAAKGEIYKNGAISQFARAYAWENNKENILTNPLQTQKNWEVDAALRKANYLLSLRGQKWDEYKDKFDMDMQEKDYQLKFQKQQFEMYGGSKPPETYLQANTKLKSPLAARLADETNWRDNYNNAVKDIAKRTGASPEQVMNAIEKYAIGDPTSVAEANLVIPTRFREQAYQAFKDKSRADRSAALREKVRRDIENSDKYKAKLGEVAAAVQNLGNVNLQMPDGSVLTYTPDEIVKIVSKQKMSSQRTALSYAPVTDITFGEDLDEKERKFVQYPGILKSDIFNKYNQALTQDLSKVQKEIDNEVDKKLNEVDITYIPRVVGVVLPGDKGAIARRSWETHVTNALLKFDSDLNLTPGADEAMSASDSKKLRGWMTGNTKDDLQYAVLTQGDKTYALVVNGNDEVTVPLTKAEALDLPVYDPGAPSEEYKEMVRVQNQGDGSTNPTGDFASAYFKRFDMPAVSYNVVADVEQDTMNPGKQYITFQIMTDIGVLPLQVQRPLDRDTALNYIHTMTNEKIKNLYLSNPLIPQDWKEAIKALP